MVALMRRDITPFMRRVPSRTILEEEEEKEEEKLREEERDKGEWEGDPLTWQLP